jgi:uncharacterized phage-associated protein
MLVADYLIANGGGRLTPLHVNKLTYISHGWTLGIRGYPLIHDRIEAWRYGPVIPVIYHTLSGYGEAEIPRLYYCRTAPDSDEFAPRAKFLKAVLKPNLDIIDKVLEMYGHLTGSELIELVHQKGSPWHTCYVKGRRGTPIPNHIIKRHYRGLVDERTA